MKILPHYDYQNKRQKLECNISPIVGNKTILVARSALFRAAEFSLYLWNCASFSGRVF